MQLECPKTPPRSNKIMVCPPAPSKRKHSSRISQLVPTIPNHTMRFCEDLEKYIKEFTRPYRDPNSHKNHKLVMMQIKRIVPSKDYIGGRILYIDPDEYLSWEW